MPVLYSRVLSLSHHLRPERISRRGIATIMAQEPARKRAKVEDGQIDASSLRIMRSNFLDSLTRPVSPPLGQSMTTANHNGSIEKSETIISASVANADSAIKSLNESIYDERRPPDLVKNKDSLSKLGSSSNSNILPSPIRLSRIQDLPPPDNVDSISLHDIVGDPLIKEAWIFNYCFDVDWMMQHFDQDVKDMVKVKIVHGSWKREDMNKIGIDDACRRLPNVEAIQTYLPDAYGTHHSKMFILFRHDDQAQIVIHTANMLAKDWTNMTQAVWQSPTLPLIKKGRPKQTIGEQFKHDLTRYLSAYGKKLKPAVEELQRYDFGEIKAVLVASVPCHFKVSSEDNQVWGHEMLSRKLETFRRTNSNSHSAHHCVYQVSSIASLPQTWLEETLYKVCKTTKDSTSIIFPTAPDVADSLDGYMAGASIHTKAQKSVHLKQISSMRPQMCRWTLGSIATSRAGRHLAAPHIKTFLRFACKPTSLNPTPDIDWALVTSANLSTQAWGSAPKLPKNQKDPQEAEIHIQSFEIGILIYPELFSDTRGDQSHLPSMVPTFMSDTPKPSETPAGTVVGFRMPYDLPLRPYASEESPWSPQSTYDAPDRYGRLWQ